MEFQLPIQLLPLAHPLDYRDNILLIGSCFTEHIGNRLSELKFTTLQNPNGILFDPHSVAGTLLYYIENKTYTEPDLFYYNELWQSWQHHSIYSNIDQTRCLQKINASQTAAHLFLKKASCIIITLGSSFSYRLTATASSNGAVAEQGTAVANCHRAPAQWFTKHLMQIDETNAVMDDCIRQLLAFNPYLQVIFTVSPVRHVRDGVVENNRSKARLIESVHTLVSRYEQLHYFPAYELVIDVLRDYRFYDIDMVHPNYPATEYVMEQFMQSCINDSARSLMEAVRKLVLARKHKAFQPATQAHRQFLQVHLERARLLQAQYPFLQWQEELAYFGSAV